eukprot:1987199-Prymnesium_polylepis.1
MTRIAGKLVGGRVGRGMAFCITHDVFSAGAGTHGRGVVVLLLAVVGLRARLTASPGCAGSRRVKRWPDAHMLVGSGGFLLGRDTKTRVWGEARQGCTINNHSFANGY